MSTAHRCRPQMVRPRRARYQTLIIVASVPIMIFDAPQQGALEGWIVATTDRREFAPCGAVGMEHDCGRGTERVRAAMDD
jgi:hypothetical protein